jgi:hypothetical protein
VPYLTTLCVHHASFGTYRLCGLLLSRPDASFDAGIKYSEHEFMELSAEISSTGLCSKISRLDEMWHAAARLPSCIVGKCIIADEGSLTRSTFFTKNNSSFVCNVAIPIGLSGPHMTEIQPNQAIIMCRFFFSSFIPPRGRVTATSLQSG